MTQHTQEILEKELKIIDSEDTRAQLILYFSRDIPIKEKYISETLDYFRKIKNFEGIKEIGENTKNLEYRIEGLNSLNKFSEVARIYAHLNKIKEAKEYYNKEILKQEKDQNYFQAGIIAIEAQLFDKAIENLENTNNFKLLAETYFKIGNYDKAVENYLKANESSLAAKVLLTSRKNKKAISVLLDNQEYNYAIDLLEIFNIEYDKEKIISDGIEQLILKNEFDSAIVLAKKNNKGLRNILLKKLNFLEKKENYEESTRLAEKLGLKTKIKENLYKNIDKLISEKKYYKTLKFIENIKNIDNKEELLKKVYSLSISYFLKHQKFQAAEKMLDELNLLIKLNK